MTKANTNEMVIIRDKRIAQTVEKSAAMKQTIKELEAQIEALKAQVKQCDDKIIAHLDKRGETKVVVKATVDNAEIERTISLSRYNRDTISATTAKKVLDSATYEKIAKATPVTRLTIK